MEWPVRRSNAMLMIPIVGSSIHCHTSAAITLEMRKGSRMTPRSVEERVTRCSTTAVSSDISVPMTTDRSTK